MKNDTYEKIENDCTPEILETIKHYADLLWSSYDDQFGYSTEKRAQNNYIPINRGDSIWPLNNQFDDENKVKLMGALALGALKSDNENEIDSIGILSRIRSLDNLYYERAIRGMITKYNKNAKNTVPKPENG